MEGVTLAVYTIALAVGCVALALVIVYQMQRSHSWSVYAIICLALLNTCIFFTAIELMSGILTEGGRAYRICTLIVNLVRVAVVTFLVSFFPYFTSYIVAKPWRNPFKGFFMGVSAVYAVFGILNIIYPSRFSDFLEIVTVVVLGYCFISISRNLNTIRERWIRGALICEIVVSVAMLPVIGITLIYSPSRRLMYGIYFLAFATAITCYLFAYFSHSSGPSEYELTLKDVEQYRISAREFSVIKLIAQGMSNREIAEQLGIKVNTVNNHVSNIYQKTGVNSRIDLLNLLKQPW